jgi:hypothetical protein
MSDRRPTAPIALTDAELTAIMVAAQPISVDRRDAFLQKVASTLRESAEVGPGTVHRAIALAQREFFDPPQLGSGSWSKYG